MATFLVPLASRGLRQKCHENLSGGMILFCYECGYVVYLICHYHPGHDSVIAEVAVLLDSPFLLYDISRVVIAALAVAAKDGHKLGVAA